MRVRCLIANKNVINEVKFTHLKKDRIFRANRILQVLSINKVMVLMVGVMILNHHIKHCAGVGYGHLRLLRVRGGDGVTLREGGGKDAPDAVCVQLKGTTNLGEEIYKR